MRARLQHRFSKEIVEVTAKADHPACPKGRMLWVDKSNKPITLVGEEHSSFWNILDKKRPADSPSFSVLCHRQGMSVNDVAKKLGISPQALRKRLRGNATIGKLQEVADVLGINVTELL